MSLKTFFKIIGAGIMVIPALGFIICVLLIKPLNGWPVNEFKDNVTVIFLIYQLFCFGVVIGAIGMYFHLT